MSARLLGLVVGWKGYAAAFAAGAILAGAAAWTIQGWQADARIATLAAQHAGVMQGYADAAYEASWRLIERQAEHQLAVAELDTRHTEDLSHANAEIDRLRAAVATGQRLRVNAACPDPAGVSATASSAGVDDAAGPRLADASERDYFALRERVARADAMIRGLQDYVREVCLSPSK